MRCAAARATPAACLALALCCCAALGPEPSRERLLERVAKDRSWRVRLARLSGLGASEPAAARCVDALADEAWQVRVEAVQQLAHLVRGGVEIEVLLATLEDAEEGSPLRRAAARSLTIATRMRFGENVADWRRWWEDEREGWEAPRPLPRLESEEPVFHGEAPTIWIRPSTPSSEGLADWMLTWKRPPAPTVWANASSAGTLGASTRRSITPLLKLSASIRLSEERASATEASATRKSASAAPPVVEPALAPSRR